MKETPLQEHLPGVRYIRSPSANSLLSEAVLNGRLGSQLVDGLHLRVDVPITPCMMPYDETSRVGMLPYG